MISVLIQIFLLCIFPNSNWIRRDTPHLSVFSLNAGKCGPEYLRMEDGIITIIFSRWFCHSYWCRNISIQMFPICLGWTKFHLKTIKLIDVFKKITKERKKNSCPEKFTSNWFSRFLNNRHCNQGKYTNKANIFFCHSLPGSRSVTN